MEARRLLDQFAVHKLIEQGDAVREKAFTVASCRSSTPSITTLPRRGAGPPSAGAAEYHHREQPSRPLLILGVHREGLHHPLPVRALDRVGLGGEDIAADLHLNLRIRIQIEIPGRMVRIPTPGSHQEVILTVTAVVQSSTPPRTRPPPHSRQQQRLIAEKIRPLGSISLHILPNVLLNPLHRTVNQPLRSVILAAHLLSSHSSSRTVRSAAYASAAPPIATDGVVAYSCQSRSPVAKADQLPVLLNHRNQGVEQTQHLVLLLPGNEAQPAFRAALGVSV